jgi:hypothetical protein
MTAVFWAEIWTEYREYHSTATCIVVDRQQCVGEALMFRRNLLLTFSDLPLCRWLPQVPPKPWYLPNRLRGAISQNTSLLGIFYYLRDVRGSWLFVPESVWKETDYSFVVCRASKERTLIFIGEPLHCTMFCRWCVVPYTVSFLENKNSEPLRSFVCTLYVNCYVVSKVT